MKYAYRFIWYQWSRYKIFFNNFDHYNNVDFVLHFKIHTLPNKQNNQIFRVGKIKSFPLCHHIKSTSTTLTIICWFCLISKIHTLPNKAKQPNFPSRKILFNFLFVSQRRLWVTTTLFSLNELDIDRIIIPNKIIGRSLKHHNFPKLLEKNNWQTKHTYRSASFWKFINTSYID